MSTENKQLVRSYLELVINGRQLDRLYEFYNPDSIWHSSPYVGVGVMPNHLTEDRYLVRAVAPNGPADGHLQPGDEIVGAADAHATWETLDQLRSGTWGQGRPGTTVTLQVRRNGRPLEIRLQRQIVSDFQMQVCELEEMLRGFLLQEWPDLQVTIQHLIGEGEMVAAYLINSGTGVEYNRPATWVECEIFRVQQGKIVESWAVEDAHSRMKQEGYAIQPPST